MSSSLPAQAPRPTPQKAADPKAAAPLPRRKRAKALLRRCDSGLFVFVILYNLLFSVAVKPLGRLLWTAALQLSPQSFFLMGSNPQDLLKSPLLLGAGLLLGIGYAFWALFEIAGILLYFDCALRDEKITLRQLLTRSFTRLLPVLRPKNLPLLLFTGVIVPFTDVVMVSGFIQSFSVPTYIMEVVEGKPLYHIAFLVLSTVLIVWTIAWLFVFHRFILEREDLPTAARQSLHLVRSMRYCGLGGLAGLLLYRFWIRIKYTFFAGLGLVLFMMMMLLLQDQIPTALAAGQMADDYLLHPLFEFVFHCFVTFAQWAYLTVLYREVIVEPTGEPQAAPVKPRHRLRLLPLGLLLGFAATGAVGAFVCLIVSQNNEALQDLLDAKVTISAHRGRSDLAPENTLPAFLAAIDCGIVDYGELDVQQTSDGVVVLTHDNNLKRCTGRNVNVYDITYEELQTLDASLDYHGPGDFSGTKIPTLDEVIKACNGKLKLNIEIKQSGYCPTLEEEVVRIIKENGFEDQCVITSLNYASLEKVDRLAPELPTGYILAVGVGNYYDLPAADFFSVETTFVTKNMVQEIHLRGKQVCSWTVDKTSDAERLINLGVDNLITGQAESIYATVTAKVNRVEQLINQPGLRTIWQEVKSGHEINAELADDVANDVKAELNIATPETAGTDLQSILDAA